MCVFLPRFNVKENSAILATAEMKGLHEAAIKTGILVPGGSSLNTARCAQAILPPRQVVFFGSIGGDQFGEILQTKCNEIGLGTVFQIRDGEKTGTCIAVLNGEHKTRTLVADLNAAVKYCFHDLSIDEDSINTIKHSKIAYASGFFLSSSFETICYVASTANTFALNLSAEFLISDYLEEFFALFPRVRILFGNYDEFSHLFRKIIDKKAELNILEEEHNFPTVEGCTDELMPSLFRFSKRYPIMNIIITNGTYPTIHAINGNILSQNVQLVSPEEIADSVGAGDAFTAGFLVRYLTDQDIFSCIKLGHILAAEILKLSGVPFNLPFHNPDMGPINAK